MVIDTIGYIEKLTPGQVAEISLTTPTSTHKVLVRYVGYIKDTCMFFHFPNNNAYMKAKDFVVTDRQMSTRFIIEGDEGAVVSCKATIVKQLVHPANILITTFPSTLEKLDLRAQKRLKIGIPISIFVNGKMHKQVQHPAMLIDISEVGGRFSLPKTAHLEQLVENEMVIIKHDGPKEAFAIKTRIKNVSTIDGRITCGVAFDENTPALKIFLQRYAYS